MNRLLLAAGGVALATIALTGCNVQGDYSPSDVAYDESSGALAESLPGDSSTEIRVDAQVIRTASVAMEVADVVDATQQVTTLVDDQGGFIQNQSLYNYDDRTSANLTARVPSERLNSFLESLNELGDVTSSSVDAQDVTLEVVDLQARITTLEESIQRLRELQQQTESVADLVAVETELANRQAELESLQARSEYLTRQVDMSTVYLTLDQENVGPGITPDFLGGVQNGWNSLLSLVAGVITVVGFAVPFLVIGGVIAGVVLLIVALTRRKDRL